MYRFNQLIIGLIGYSLLRLGRIKDYFQNKK